MPVLLALGVVFLVAMMASLPAFFLWNWLMPDIFGLVEITWLQSLGLCFLFRSLFGTGSKSSSED